MTSRLRRSLLCASLAAVVLPAGASAAPAEVAPPGAGDRLSASATAPSSAAADPGCQAKNTIAFKGQDPGPYRVRHTGLIRCTNINVRIRCVANLFRGDQRISHLADRGDDRCRIGSPFSASKRYPAGTQFTQNYTYKLTLQNPRKRWAGTTRRCPRRTNERRTLICKGSHTTVAPERSVARISS